jgi:hypothetical protein
MRLYREVIRFRRGGLSYVEVIDRVESLYWVRLNEGHISFWSRRLHNLYNGVYMASLDFLKSSEWFAYLIGL